MQYFEALLHNEQSDNEQSDNEQSDNEQSDNEQSDNHILLFVEQILNAMTSDELVKIYFRFKCYINRFSICIFSAEEIRTIYAAFNEKENEFCIEL